MAAQTSSTTSKADFKFLEDAYGLSLEDGVEFSLPDSMSSSPPPLVKWVFTWRLLMLACVFLSHNLKRKFCKIVGATFRCLLLTLWTRSWHLKWYVGLMAYSHTTLFSSIASDFAPLVLSTPFPSGEGSILSFPTGRLLKTGRKTGYRSTRVWLVATGIKQHFGWCHP